MIPDRPGRYRRRRVIVETVDIFESEGGVLCLGQAYDQYTGETEWLSRAGDLETDYGTERVPVHADGGECHGTALVDGRCPGCGLIPDM